MLLMVAGRDRTDGHWALCRIPGHVGVGVDQPLGLPKGSIRSVVTLLIVGAYIVYPFFGCLAPDGFREVAVLIIGWYFGQRGQQ